jgi:hypothetical protein
LSRVRTLLVYIFAAPALLQAAPHIYPIPVPQELRSNAFTITVNGKPVDVAHAAASYDFASFDTTGAVDIEITASEQGFWDHGVDIEPWRLGIRAQRAGQTIRFHLEGSAKLSISRPRDFLNHASMLFLFAGSPPPTLPKGANVKIYSAGVYRESLNPKTGETIYLAPGVYIYGSLNVWKVDNVKVLGRGVIIYDGPQNPNDDDGWMQKRDWHCVDSLEAHHIEIDGLTCILRSRTWSIQMKNSSDFTYDDLRVIGGNPGNANQDGMDWIGSTNGVVRNSFFRASDDVIALMGNWDGYTEADLLRPGLDVHDILVENSQLSTSVSNVVRAGWPEKIFNSHNFTLRNSDILHAGIGACGQTFGLIGFWGAKDAKGLHQSYTFENIFLDNWYSLAQLEQEQPALKDFTFRNIWALDQPPVAASTIQGDVSGVTFENVKYGQHVAENNADIPITVNAVQQPHYAPSTGPIASFTLDNPVISMGQEVTFTAIKSAKSSYTWHFGDGTSAKGSTVHHVYKDADGSDLDGANGAGHFRVLLQVKDNSNREDWSARGLVVVNKWQDATPPAGPMLAGLDYRIYPGAWTELPDLKKATVVITGDTPNLNADAHGFERYAVVWDGLLDIPADGGYTFHLMDRDGARIVLDGIEVARTGPPFANVCGTIGNAMRYSRGSLGLRAGLHTFHVEQLHNASNSAPRVLWEGPSLPIADIPPAAFVHPRQDVIKAR